MTRKMLYSIFLLCALCCGLALGYLWIFLNFIIYKELYLGEPNPFILWFEIVVWIAIIAFSLTVFTILLRRARRERDA